MISTEFSTCLYNFFGGAAKRSFGPSGQKWSKSTKESVRPKAVQPKMGSSCISYPFLREKLCLKGISPGRIGPLTEPKQRVVIPSIAAGAPRNFGGSGAGLLGLVLILGFG